jgi:hypothetical protein
MSIRGIVFPYIMVASNEDHSYCVIGIEFEHYTKPFLVNFCIRLLAFEVSVDVVCIESNTMIAVQQDCFTCAEVPRLNVYRPLRLLSSKDLTR